MKRIDKDVYGPWALVTGASSGIGEALHVELRQAGVNVTLLVPVLVDTPVVACIGINRMGCRPSPSQVFTITRADMTAAFEGMEGTVAEMIKRGSRRLSLPTDALTQAPLVQSAKVT